MFMYIYIIHIDFNDWQVRGDQEIILVTGSINRCEYTTLIETIILCKQLLLFILKHLTVNLSQ